MIRIKSTADLDKLHNQERAVVFLWVNWAVQAHNSVTIAERMICEWNHNHPKTELDLLQIDLSEQFGEMWNAVSQWLESQNIRDPEALLCGGAGSIIWVRSGTIMQHVVNAASETLNRLLAITSQSFGSSGTTEAK